MYALAFTYKKMHNVPPQSFTAGIYISDKIILLKSQIGSQ